MNDLAEREAHVLAAAEEREKERRRREERLIGEQEQAEEARDWLNPYTWLEVRKELRHAGGRAIAGAAENTFEAISALDEWAMEHVGALDLNPFDNTGQGIYRSPEELALAEAESDFRVPEEGWRLIKDLIPEPETGYGQFAESAGRFVLGFVGAGKLKWVGNLKNSGGLAGAAGWMVQGAIADFTVLDGHEERLSDLLIQFDNPILNNAVTQYLAVEGSDTDVGELEGRIKNVLEGAGFGLLADGIIGGLRVLAPAKRVRSYLEEREALRRDREMFDAIDNTPVDDTRPLEFVPENDAVDLAKETSSGVEAAGTKPRKVQLDSSVDIDSVRATVQRIVDEGEAEQLIAALAKGDSKTVLKLSGRQQHYIDWDSFADDPKSLLQFVRAIEDTFEEAITAAKGGKVPTAETVKRGLRLIEKQTGSQLAGNLLSDVTADGGLSSRVFAGAQLLQESRTKLRELAQLAAGGDAQASAKLLQHANTHAVLEAQVTGSSSEIGRAMRAMQIIKENRLSDTFDLDEMLREAGQVGDATAFAKRLLAADDNAISGVVKKQLKATPLDKALEILYGNLLSAPTTQMVNIIGNAGMALFDYTVRTTAAIPGMASRLLGGRGSAALDEWLGASVGVSRGIRNALSFSLKLEDWVNAGRSLNWQKVRSGELRQLIQDTDKMGTFYKALLTGDAQTDVVTKLGEAGSARKAIAYRLPDDIGNKPLLASVGHYSRWIVENTVGPLIRIPGRLIVSTDELFKSVARDTERYAQVYADARSTQKAMGDPRVKVQDVAAAMLDLAQDDPGSLLRAREVNKKGIEFARKQTFQSKLEGGSVMNAFGRFEKFVSETKGLRLLFPFVRTPVNLALQTVELTGPGALLSRRFREELAAGGVRQEKAMAQMALTTGAAYMLYEKFAAGELRGTGSGNNSSNLEGVDRYSIKLGDTWVSFSRLDPFGAFIGFSADMFELFENYELSPDAEAEGQSVFTGFLAAFSANFTNKTYLRGLSELVEAMTYAERGSSRALEGLVGSTLFNLMPFVGSNFERRRAEGQDEFARYIFSWKDEFASRLSEGGSLLSIFGYEGRNREDLGVRRDPLGRPIQVKGQLGPDSRLWNPIDTSSESTSVLDRALAAMDFNISMPSRNISGVQLDGNQYSKLLYLRGQEVKIAGMTLEERLLREVESPVFQARTPEGRADRINDLVREYGVKARKQLLREDDALRTQVDAARQRDKDALSVTITQAQLEQEAQMPEYANPIEQLAEAAGLTQ